MANSKWFYFCLVFGMTNLTQVLAENDNPVDLCPDIPGSLCATNGQVLPSQQSTPEHSSTSSQVTTGPCQDKDPQCRYYDKSACSQDEFKAYMEKNCPRSCGLCGTCTYLGTNATYNYGATWRDGCLSCTCVHGGIGKYNCTTGCPRYQCPAGYHCSEFTNPDNPCCKLMKIDGANPTTPPQNGTLTPANPSKCEDKIPNCAIYGDDFCRNESYKVFAHHSCPMHCGFCACKDVQDKDINCAYYEDGFCTHENFTKWAKINCRNFCGLCADPTQITTTATASPLNVCSFNPCRNGGRCSLQGNDFLCACPDSFDGIVCEHHVVTTTATTMTTTSAPVTADNSLPHRCSFNPCRHGGFCVATGPKYECYCPANYSGILCETGASSSSQQSSTTVTAGPCSFNPCKNSGFCVSAQHDYKCFCPETYSGQLCEVQVTATTDSVPKSTHLSLMTTLFTQTVVPYSKCQADIQFLVDESASVGYNNHYTQVQFVGNLVSTLFEGSPSIRIGFAEFHTIVDDQFHMNWFTSTPSSLKDMVRAIETTRYHGGGGETRTDLALNFARTSGFAPEYGARPGVPKVLILITDGPSSSPTSTKTEADLLLKSNVKVIAVGVGDHIDMAELKLITGDTSQVFTVSNFPALDQVKTAVLDCACG